MTRHEPANDTGRKEEPGESSTLLGLCGAVLAVVMIAATGAAAVIGLAEAFKPIASQAEAAFTPHIRSN